MTSNTHLHGDSNIDQSIGGMLQLGFTKSEASLYMSLIRFGECSAGKLARRTGIDRVDVYRHLKRLAEKQVVDIVLGSPVVYKPKDPEYVLQNMYRNKQQVLNSIRDYLPALTQNLETLKATGASEEAPEKIDSHDYRLAYGRVNYISDVSRMTEKARTSLLIILTPNAMKRAFRSGTVNLWRRKLEDDLDIRMIVNESSEGGKEALHLAERFDTRSSTSAIMRLTIFDNISTLLCASDDVDLTMSNPSDVYLKTSDRRFTMVMKLLFDHMWKNSRQIRSK